MAQAYETTIGPRTRLRGRVHGDGDLALEGQLEGNVALGGKLTVHEGGAVKGEASASEVVVAGELEGPVRSEGSLHVASTGKVNGVVRVGGLSLEDGARFHGEVHAAFDLPAELAEKAPAAPARR
jgi:cytoskeletal protein CcmA (bactofilin family)